MPPPTHRQEVLLKDLPTRSVTFYPARALINREIPNLELNYGANEIEIYGLTPTTDEHSIKIDGFGAASVTDMTVDLVPNRETFAQVYPDELDYEDSDSEPEDENEEVESQDIKDCLATIKDMEKKLDRERVVSADIRHRQGYLNEWYRNLGGKDAIGHKVADLLSTYQDENLKMSDQLRESSDNIERFMKDQSRAQKELRALTQDVRRKERKESIEKAKKVLQEKVSEASAKKEKQRIRDERAKYFPKKVYKVTIHLDVAAETPGTSRRSSVSSVTISKNQELGDSDIQDTVTSIRANLQLSYITLDASWAPRYDIEFATTQRSGKISYRAEFTNKTSETWEQTKVSLSTSQASFRGLEDQVPWMRWWRIGLTRPNGGAGALTSLDEQNALSHGPSQAYNPSRENRAELFGIDEQSADYKRNLDYEVRQQQAATQHSAAARTAQTAGSTYAARAQTAGSSHAQGQSQPPAAFAASGLNGQSLGGLLGHSSLFGGAHQAQVESLPIVSGRPGGGLFGQPSVPTAGFGSSSTAQTPALPSSHSSAPRSHGLAQDTDAALVSKKRTRMTALSSHGVFADEEEADEEDNDMGVGLFDAPTHSRVDFEDTTYEDHGLTTTYDIPNTRTIEPSSLTRRHKIATLPFSNLVLTSISVPKLRQAAFLRARFRNPSSSITLLKGVAGLTLDGTFLGNTTLPRISPGELITLPLGVDPALHVSYARPVVKRSTHGVFNKEAAQVFTRSIVVTNTKSVAAELLVLDQVPISEDERLRVEIIEPRGLTGEGVTVSTGVNAQAGKGKWGSAKATLKKNGEIAFNVLLEKGAAARLAVEYEARAPTTEAITSK